MDINTAGKSNLTVYINDIMKFVFSSITLLFKPSEGIPQRLSRGDSSHGACKIKFTSS